MSSFEATAWADPAFAQSYLEQADHYIPDRQKLLGMVRSFYRRFGPSGRMRVCDLGCGDGALTAQLLPARADAEFVLVDGSAEMLKAAQKRLGSRTNLTFQECSFQQLLDGTKTLPPCHFVVTAFAIHHLTMGERGELFRILRQYIEPGGFFLNVDVVLPDDAATEEWYYAWWQEWVDDHVRRCGLGDELRSIPQQARANPDNQYGPLSEQLSSLRTAGFEAVECHYRDGLFGVYSGRR